MYRLIILLVALAVAPAAALAQARVERPTLNLATYTEDLGSWNVAAGTPTRTLNDFNDANGNPTCDTVVDDDPANQEGYQTNNFTVLPGTYSFSCVLAAGTADSAYMRIAVTGTATVGHGTACTFSSIPARPTRYSCPATIGGAPITTSVWAIRVGSAVTTTGTLRVCQCQITPGATPATYSGAATTVLRSNRIAIMRKNRI